jgi:hypothetical protein
MESEKLDMDSGLVEDVTEQDEMVAVVEPVNQGDSDDSADDADDENFAREIVVTAIEAYLETLHYTMWPSNGWDISKPDRRREAAEWATDQFDNIDRFLTEKGL